MPLQDKFMQLLKMSGLSYAGLSDLSGVSTATISRVVNGANINVDNMEVLIAALEKYIANLDPAPTPEPADDLPQRCKHCQAETVRHNDAMRAAFERHEALLRESYEQRIAEIKAGHEREMAQAERALARIQKRAAGFTIAFCLLAFAVAGMFVYDWTHGAVGWYRFMSERAEASTGIIRMIKDWLHLL